MKSMKTTASPRRSVNLTDRDLRLLRGLFEVRLATLAHLAVLYFEGSLPACTKRLQKLKHAGFVGERERRPYEPSLLYLSPQGFRELNERGALDGLPRLDAGAAERRTRVSPLTLRHELAVMDVRAAFHAAISRVPPLTIETFTTWPLLSQFYASAIPGGPETLCRPDGFICIAERESDGNVSDHYAFLEVDRSTESQGVLAAKAVLYRDFYARGGLAARFGRPRSEWKAWPFRLLVICPNEERRNNLAERLLQLKVPILTQVWITTIAQVLSDPLGPIWLQPVDYRDAVAGTPYEATATTPDDVYRRRVGREQHVARSVQLNPLVGNGIEPCPVGNQIAHQ
jgi:hypothetical protein